MDYIIEEARRRNHWLFEQNGRELRLADGTKFRGVEHYHGGIWSVEPEPVLARGDVVEVKGCLRRIVDVRAVRARGKLLQQDVQFE